MSHEVILINPPQVFTKNQVASGITPPLGIAYLASVLELHDITVDIIDSVGLEPQTIHPFEKETFVRGVHFGDIVARLDDEVKIVGISNLFSFAYPVVQELCRQIRAFRSDIKIVLGGPHPSALYEEVLTEDKDLVDFVILGEGELPFLELCQKLLQQNMVLQTNIGSDIANLAFLDEDGKCVMGTEKLARNTKLNSDTIPFPARHLLPMENYILAQESHGFSNGRWTSMISSRGCPYGCTFCASRKTRWVSRSATDVADEIEYCIENWDIREFHFEDDNMTINVKRLIEICNEIKRRKLDIRWQTPNGIRASRIDEEMLTAMKDSGCEHVTLAPESGSPRVLTDIVQKGKDFDLQHLKDCGATAHKIGLKVAAYFVLGLPGETREDMEMTIAYARELAKVGVDEVNFGLFIPLPGTPLWEPSKHKIKDLDWLDLLTVGDLAKAVSFNDEVGSKELDWVRKKAYMSFLLTRIIYHPTQFAGTIFNVFRGIEKTKSERVLRNLVRRYKKDAKDGINKLVFDNRTFYAYRHMYRKIFRLIFR
ncbi:B12-binding domain-containing radical SAM protein [Candidatus Marimicrobium litorale]|uniref:B12-binding domain-containing radical SAM protein n=1 Tax=Candidatus Marimicrobium litorale TaxID=2518991 RepID=A0ABT3T3G5_9GAMM|nr:radical SAM protein [Candidatus Marimicrobium litorale]MCX2976811.1 B12-binding domain-containing radical SAM protein [Candidatus Marimicrobium litorale]